MNEASPIASDGLHSRRSRSTLTSAPARKVSTTPAKPAMKISHCCGSAPKTLPMTTPASSSRIATETPARTETMLASSTAAASSVASASEPIGNPLR